MSWIKIDYAIDDLLAKVDASVVQLILTQSNVYQRLDNNVKTATTGVFEV